MESVRQEVKFQVSRIVLPVHHKLSDEISIIRQQIQDLKMLSIR